MPQREHTNELVPAELDPAVWRMKDRLLSAPYEICMARARYFTEVYRETKGMDAALRNALALKRTLARQQIFVYRDERLAGSKTEKFLAAPLSVDRGDFLRTLQLEMDILHKKQRPFYISKQDRRLFWDEVLPYWDGRTVRDHKARQWEAQGIINTRPSPLEAPRRLRDTARFARYVGKEGLARALGTSLSGAPSPRRLKNLLALRHEWARNNPTPAVYCFDVQGHLCLGVDRVVQHGMAAIIEGARQRLLRLQSEQPGDRRGAAFLRAVIISLEAAIAYSERFASTARAMARRAGDEGERRRLQRIARACRRVPRLPPRSFAEALQAAWMAHVVGEIQYGNHDVFAPGRVDQFLYPFFRADLDRGALTEAEALALVQEYLLKLSANVEPIPELGMESNAVLGNSQHCVMVGGQAADGQDATNELSYLLLDAYEQLNGTVNQLCARVHPGSPDGFLRRVAAVFRRTNGIALYNDEAVVEGLVADGMKREHARDYCIVGCVETSGQSDTHGCPGGHELVLPAVLLLALTGGRYPPPAPGQQQGFSGGDPLKMATFETLLTAFRRQLSHQISVLVEAVAAKDWAHRKVLPAPYVSALMEGCIDQARDITAGGARYDFTSLDVRGLATLVDSLLAIKTFVYQRPKPPMDLQRFMDAVLANFEGHEELRCRLINRAPKYGTGDPAADELTLQVLEWIHGQLAGVRNIRDGRYRACYYSYGNHVIDGLLLGATPDGRRRGEPISNGVSPSNLIAQPAGPLDAMRTVASFPPSRVSSGLALNVRFHPGSIASDQGLDTFAAMIRTYFSLGGMHIQPNVVSTETLRAAQQRPDEYRDLVVKVSGYSGYFCDLGRSIQEDIIARTEFGG